MKPLLFLLLIAVRPCFGQPIDQGDLIYQFEPSANYPVAKMLANDAGLSEFRRHVNQTLALPRDIPVRFCECGIENADYNHQTKTIRICHEYVQAALKRMKRGYSYPDRDVVSAVAMTVLGHELGHALIDQFDLPVIGREEDAADQFSAILLLNSHRFYRATLIGTLSWYAAWKDAGKRFGLFLDRNGAYADVHSLTGVRYYNYLAYLCGYRIDLSSSLIGDGDSYKLPVSRAKRARYDYLRATSTWNKLLASHYKTTETPYEVADSVATVATPQRAAVAIDAARLETLTPSLKMAISPNQWHVAYFPVNEFPKVSGEVTYKIGVHSSGQIVGVTRLQSSITDQDEQITRKAMAKVLFLKDSNQAENINLTVTVTLRN